MSPYTQSVETYKYTRIIVLLKIKVPGMLQKSLAEYTKMDLTLGGRGLCQQRGGGGGGVETH